MEFDCSPCACISFFCVLWFPPKDMRARLICDSKLAIGGNLTENGFVSFGLSLVMD